MEHEGILAVVGSFIIIFMLLVVGVITHVVNDSADQQTLENRVSRTPEIANAAGFRYAYVDQAGSNKVCTKFFALNPVGQKIEGFVCGSENLTISNLKIVRK